MTTLIAFHPHSFAAVLEVGHGRYRYLQFPYDRNHQWDCDDDQLGYLKIYAGMVEFSMTFESFPAAKQFVSDLAYRKEWLITTAHEPESLLRCYRTLKIAATSGILDRVAHQLDIDPEVTCWALIRLVGLQVVHKTPELSQRATALWNRYLESLHPAQHRDELKALIKHLIYTAHVTERPSDVALYAGLLHRFASSSMVSDMDVFRHAFLVGEWDDQEAIWAYTQFIKKAPKVPVGYNNRGNHYADVGEFDLAFADFTKAMDLKPRYLDALYNRAHSCDKFGHHDLAIKDYTQLIAWNPGSSSAYNGRAYTYFRMGNYAQAMADMEIVMDLAPDRACNLATMAELHGALGNEDLFYEFLERALRQDAGEYGLLHEKTLAKYAGSPRFLAIVEGCGVKLSPPESPIVEHIDADAGEEEAADAL